MTERTEIKEEGRTVCYCDYYSVLDELEIVFIETETDYRNRGYATRLMEELISLCREKDIRVIRLEVRESNAPALGLYGKIGFVPVGRRKNYYSDPREDAILMDLEIKKEA